MPDLPDIIVQQFVKDSEIDRNLKAEAQAANIELYKKGQAADISFDKRS